MLPSETIRRSIEDRLFGRDRVGPSLWLPVAGGLSRAAVWRVACGESRFAVRRWWSGIDPRHVAWIAATLREVVRGGLHFVAAPLGDDDNWPYRDAHDGRWEAAPWMPGAPLTRAGADAAALRAAAEGLARFHTALRRQQAEIPAGGHPLDDRLQKLEGLRATPLGFPRRILERWPTLGPIAAALPTAVSEALRTVMSLAESPVAQQTIHGDARPDHFLVEGGRLTGLVDFATLRRDSPMADLARLAGEVVPGDSGVRELVTAFYEDAVGEPVDRRLVAALDLSGAVLSAANWLRWLSDPHGPERPAELVDQRLRSIAARLAGEGANHR